MILVLSVAGLVLALIPAMLFAANLPLFTKQVVSTVDKSCKSVSVLIPARDEEAGIGETIKSILASRDVNLEVVVLDDDSQDATPQIVRNWSQADGRVRCISGTKLPPQWNGKQHACYQLSKSAQFEHLVFLDADVRLRPEALSQLLNRLDQSGVALLSAFPHQQTGTWLEKLIIPLMHFILLGFLPLRRMRKSTSPAYSAGCGQLFLTTARDYQRAGTHAKIHSSRHDGVKLPRAYREVGLGTDVIDGTELADCRMYHSASQVVVGVLKNAVEGVANPRAIVPFSILLLGSSVLPVATLVGAALTGHVVGTAVSILGLLTGHAPRAMAAVRFRQPWFGVVGHSVSVLLFVGLQWFALVQHLCGRQVAWRGRSQT